MPIYSLRFRSVMSRMESINLLFARKTWLPHAGFSPFFVVAVHWQNSQLPVDCSILLSSVIYLTALACLTDVVKHTFAIHIGRTYRTHSIYARSMGTAIKAVANFPTATAMSGEAVSSLIVSSTLESNYFNKNTLVVHGCSWQVAVRLDLHG